MAQVMPGQPTPQQIQQMQQALAAEAQRRGMTVEQFQAEQRAKIETEAKAHGMTPEQYVQKLRADAIANHQRQQAQMQQQQQQAGGQPQQQAVQQQQHAHPHPHQHPQSPQQGQQVPINPNNPPNPQAIALVKWLRNQDLKTRTCILNGQRKDMFKVKRALRAIESPAYAKAASNPKNGLPPITATMPPPEILKLLPLSFLALRVSKVEPEASATKKKRVKGLWTVKIEQQQDIQPDLHYVFLYEGSQWKNKVYAGLAVTGILAVVLFPLWPATLRLGVWYLSMAMLGLLALFFAMAIFRLILFCITFFAVPPGLWLYPNLFEDVGFFDSFKPLWGWQEDPKAAKKAKRDQRKAKAEAKATRAGAVAADGATTPAAGVAQTDGVAAGDAATSGAAPQEGETTRRSLAPRVEEVEDSD